MKRVLAMILRAFWVSVAFVIAVYCAGAIVILSKGSMWAPPAADPLGSTADMIETALYIGVTGSFIGQAFLVPAIVAIISAEILLLRSFLSNLIGGAIVAASSGMLTYIVPQTHISDIRAWEILLAAGILSGAIYWLIAGHSAGRWREIGQPLFTGKTGRFDDDADHQIASE